MCTERVHPLRLLFGHVRPVTVPRMYRVIWPARTSTYTLHYTPQSSILYSMQERRAAHQATKAPQPNHLSFDPTWKSQIAIQTQPVRWLTYILHHLTTPSDLGRHLFLCRQPLSSTSPLLFIFFALLLNSPAGFVHLSYHLNS